MKLPAATLTDSLRKCLRMIPAELRWRLLMAAPLNLTVALLESASAGAIYLLVKIVSDPTQIAQLPGASLLLLVLPMHEPKTVILTFTALLGAFYFFKVLFTVWAAFVSRRALSQANVRVASTFFRAYLTAPYAFHFRRNSSDVVHQVNQIIPETLGGTISAYTLLFMEIVVSGGLLITMLVAAPMVTATLVLLTGICLYVMLRWTDARIVRSGEQAHQFAKLQGRNVTQGLGALKEIKVLGREGHFLDAYESLVAGSQQALLQKNVIETIPRVVIEAVFAGAGLVAVALYVLSHDRGEDVVPLLGLYAYAAFRLIPTANRITLAVSDIRWRKKVVERIYADYCEITALTDTVNVSSASSGPAVQLTDRIAFEHVGFKYDDTAPFALRDLSLHVARGESCGIVGPSGAGKSTVIDLLLGLLRPTEGRISVDGRDIRELGVTWSKSVGYVPQVIYLADDTIRNNVALGVASEQIDDQRVWAALAMAQLDDFVRTLPGELNAEVGERGARLSGGQRQRIGIARALYHDPAVLVFDEATSALDAATEAEVSRAIESLLGQKTIIIVAHRLTTVQSCDRLFFLVDGQLQATGSYEELVRDEPHFRRMALASE